MIQLAKSSDPFIRALLAEHPRVVAVAEGGSPGIEFVTDGWNREVRVGDPSVGLFGLTEIMDNNPMVCADVLSVPDAITTLALIALAPLAQAGLLLEEPTMLSNLEGDVSDAFLVGAGWSGGLVQHTEPQDLQGVAAATVIAAIRTPDDLEDLDALFDERYERSFFIHRDESSDWDVKLVKGKPSGLYRLRINPDEPSSLLTVRVMADLNGKCGAAQVVHAMNVMCGFEESLGV